MESTAKGATMAYQPLHHKLDTSLCIDRRDWRRDRYPTKPVVVSASKSEQATPSLSEQTHRAVAMLESLIEAACGQGSPSDLHDLAVLLGMANDLNRLTHPQRVDNGARQLRKTNQHHEERLLGLANGFARRCRRLERIAGHSTHLQQHLDVIRRLSSCAQTMAKLAAQHEPGRGLSRLAHAG